MDKAEIIVNGASTVRQENSNIDPGLGAATSSVRLAWCLETPTPSVTSQ